MCRKCIEVGWYLCIQLKFLKMLKEIQKKRFVRSYPLFPPFKPLISSHFSGD